MEGVSLATEKQTLTGDGPAPSRGVAASCLPSASPQRRYAAANEAPARFGAVADTPDSTAYSLVGAVFVVCVAIATLVIVAVTLKEARTALPRSR